MGKRRTQEEVENIFSIEGYKLVDTFNNVKTKMVVICPNNHTIYPTLSNFLGRKSRCIYCVGKNKYTQEEIESIFLKEGYKVVEPYIKSGTTIGTICPVGHNWKARIGDFLRGTRCSKCCNLARYSQEEIEKIFSDNGYTVISIYKNMHTKIEVICPNKHKIFITPHSFKNHGNRCKACKNTGTSKAEIEILNIVKLVYPKTRKLIERKINIISRPHITRFEIDIYVPELNKGIEFDGRYWHSFDGLKRSHPTWPHEDIRNYHEIKDAWFTTKGIKILHIKEEDWLKDKEECIRKCLEFLK